MAKLGVYYALCPLIDHRSLLGVSEDADRGNVIVTLGKNIAVKYKLHDQKQLVSWRSKDKFSSPIIYDKETQKYTAIFNSSCVKVWSNEEESLDKLKKLKFEKPLHTLLQVNKKTYLVFNCGTVITLDEALRERKTFVPEAVIDEKSESISDILYTSAHGNDYIGFLIYDDEGPRLVWRTFSETAVSSIDTIRLHRDGVELQGYLCHTNNKDEAVLFTLWSDGRMYVYNLNDYTNSRNKEPELFSVIESLSCKHCVTMASLNKNYIAIFGANASEEGAVVMIYNLQFKVSQSRQVFKLFTNGARLWCINNNLLLCVGQNLAVLPYKLDMERLATLVGSHKIAPDDVNSDLSIVLQLQQDSWRTNKDLQTEQNLIPEKIEKQIKELSQQGLAENQICEDILPGFIEQNDLESISCYLDYFQDIPEICLANLLKCVLSVNSKSFRSNKLINSESYPVNLQPLERSKLINKILVKSFCDILLLPHLRNELDINHVLLLLQYLYYMLSSDNSKLPSLNYVQGKKKIVEWVIITLDANYQKFLLSKDTNINNTFIHLLDLVNSHLTYLGDLQEVFSLLTQLKKGKSVCTDNDTNTMYSIELVDLY